MALLHCEGDSGHGPQQLIATERATRGPLGLASPPGPFLMRGRKGGGWPWSTSSLPSPLAASRQLLASWLA